MRNVSHFGETITRPGLQRRKASLTIIRLAGLMVLATDDDEILPLRERLQTHVVIRIQSVPIKRVLKETLWQFRRDGVSAIGCLLAVDRHPHVYRRVGGNYHIRRFDLMTGGSVQDYLVLLLINAVNTGVRK